MVPETRIELVRKYKFRGILNPLCLPISPLGQWRRVPESNWTTRICNPLHNRFANAPSFIIFGAGNEARTRDPNLGKVMLYQLSYSRIALMLCIIRDYFIVSKIFSTSAFIVHNLNLLRKK